MIRFKTIKLVNFMSYGAIPTIIQLDQPGTALILGEDLDHTTSGSGSNGVGKTSILNAIVYALYDNSIDSEISKDDLVNNINDKKMEVTIEFEKDEHTYIVVRVRKAKFGAAGNTTTLFEDGKDITLDSANNTNALIEKIVGVPFELFVRIVAFSATNTPFLKLPVRSPYAANQTDIIEELFGLKTLSEKAEALKVEIKETEALLKEQTQKIDSVKKEQERHQRQIESANKRVETWVTSNAQEIEDIKHRIERLQNINVEEQRTIYDRVVTLTTITQDILQQKKEKAKELQSVEHTIEHHEGELSHLYKGECPRCHQTFHESQENLAGIDKEVSKAKSELPELQNIITNLDENWEKHNTELKAQRKLLQVQKLEELMEIKGKLEQLTTKFSELETAQNPYTEALQELQAMEIDAVNMAEVNELKLLLDHQSFLLKLLTKKDSFVRKALLNKHLPFLNQRLKKYLTDLGLPHTVEFTHEMTAKISQFDRPLGFGNLSNGQKARVNLALSFAFRDVLQSMHEYVNICMLDEVLDVGLDAVGVQVAARMLKRKARDEKLGVYIISHRDEIDSAFDRKLIVQMSGGFSSIRYEDA